MRDTAIHLPHDRAPAARPGNRADQAGPGRLRTGPPKRPVVHRTTLYRFDLTARTTADLAALVNHDYLHMHGFPVAEGVVAGAPAIVVHGQVPCETANWCTVIAGMTGVGADVGYSSAGGAVLVAVDEHVYALTFGTLGRYLIDLDRADRTFGISFAIRALKPAQIKRLTRHVLAATGRVDRNAVPGGQHIRSYVIEPWGEIVGQLCGQLNNERLTVSHSTKRPVTVTGSDAVQIALSTDPAGLLSDLREIGRVCARETPAPELEFIAQVRPLPAGDPQVHELNERLDALLGQVQPDGLGLAIPTNQVEVEPLATSYEIRVPQRRIVHTELTLDAVLDRTRRLMPGRRLPALRHGSIALCSDAEEQEQLAQAVSANKWITAEIPLGALRMVYHEGQWYEIGAQHLEFLRSEVAAILDRPPSITLPPWTAQYANEQAYNRSVGAPGSGFVMLDRTKLRTRQHHHSNGIEACDLLGPRNELIHVKRAAGSSPLSHLFFQGEVAIDALRHEADARQRLVDLVHAADPTWPIGVDFTPTKIIYAISLGLAKPLTAASLFTFAQVALYRTVRRLRGDNIDVEVIAIPS